MAFFSKTRGLVSGIGLVLIGIACLVYGLIVSISLRKPPVDLYQADWETLHANQHVVVDLEFLFYDYMTYSKNGEVTTRFYVVPDIQNTEDDFYYMAHFMGLAAVQKDFALYDRISDNSKEWWYDETGMVTWAPETVHLDGYLRKMSKNDKQYMTEYLQEMGYSDEEIEGIITPYVLMTNGSSMSGIAIAGVITLLLGGVILFFTFRQIIKEKQANEAISSNFGRSTYGGTGYSGTAGGTNYYGGGGGSSFGEDPFGTSGR